MKNAVSAIALAAFFAVPASAADLKNQGDPTASNYVETPSFTGFYVGGRIGYGNANHDLTVNQYNGGYCFDQNGSEDVVGTGDRDTTDYWSVTDYAHIDNIPVSGLCDAASLNGTQTGSNNVPHGTGIGQGLSGWTEDDHVQVASGGRNVANIDGVNSHGIIGGFQAGYDQQIGRIVVGVFGAYDFSGMETTGDIGSISNPDSALELIGIEKQDEWSIGARAGLLVNPKTLVYILAAYTQTEYDFTGTKFDGDEAAFTKTTTFDGVSVGGGIEFALTQNVFLGMEYVHTFYGEETVLDTGGTEVGGFGQKIVDDLDEDKVMATLKVKLNSGLGF